MLVPLVEDWGGTDVVVCVFFFFSVVEIRSPNVRASISVVCLSGTGSRLRR